MIWVINSNSNLCRMYQYEPRRKKLELIKEIEHPENKLKSGDLISDRPGHYKSSNSSRGAFSQPSDPKEIKIDSFFREIAKNLNQERNKHSYDELIIITPPHLNGLLYQHLDKHVKSLVINNIQKDLLHLAEHELIKFLLTHAQYPATKPT